MSPEFYQQFFSDVFRSFYYFALIFSVLAGVICFRSCSKGFKAIAILLMVTFISEVAAKYLVFDGRFSNNIVYHIFTPIEFILYAIIYNNFLGLTKWRKILIGSALFIIIAEVVNSAFFQELSLTNTNTIILESVLLIILSLRLFLKIGESAIFQNITMSGVFWFNSAVLIYYSFNILVWGFHNIKVYQLKNPPTIIYQLLLVLSGILYLTFAISIMLHIYNNKIKYANE